MIKECVKCGCTFEAVEDRFDSCRDCQVIKRILESRSDKLFWAYHYRNYNSDTHSLSFANKFLLAND